MVEIPDNTNTTLYMLENGEIAQQTRPYLGMSMLGHSCARYLWYTFRWCYTESHTPRKLRLFNRGHREEPAMIEQLQKIGIRIWGQQEEMITGHGHIKGHCDGICDRVIEAPKAHHLLEFKTVNDAGMKSMRKNGIKMHSAVYYAQVQMYMKHLNLTRCLFMAVNKNDDSYYIERIKYNENIATNIEKRAENIILSEGPPKKEFDSTWYECKWCSARGICFLDEDISESCRSCQHCDLCPKGRWECSKHTFPLTTNQQRLKLNCYERLDTID